jgi:hypothetical protein
MPKLRATPLLALSLLTFACGPRGYDGDCAHPDATGLSYDVGPNDDAHYRATSGFSVRTYVSLPPEERRGTFFDHSFGYFRSRDSQPATPIRTVGSCREYDTSTRFGLSQVDPGPVRVEATGSQPLELGRIPGLYLTPSRRLNSTPDPTPLDPWLRPGARVRVSSTGSSDFPAFELCETVPPRLELTAPFPDPNLARAELRRFGEPIVLEWAVDGRDDEVFVVLRPMAPLPGATPTNRYVECTFSHRDGRGEISAELLSHYDARSNVLSLEIVRSRSITRVFDGAPLMLRVETETYGSTVEYHAR